jgi:hypothetical protein
MNEDVFENKKQHESKTKPGACCLSYYHLHNVLTKLTNFSFCFFNKKEPFQIQISLQFTSNILSLLQILYQILRSLLLLFK